MLGGTTVTRDSEEGRLGASTDHAHGPLPVSTAQRLRSARARNSAMRLGAPAGLSGSKFWHYNTSTECAL